MASVQCVIFAVRTRLYSTAECFFVGECAVVDKTVSTSSVLITIETGSEIRRMEATMLRQVASCADEAYHLVHDRPICFDLFHSGSRWQTSMIEG